MTITTVACTLTPTGITAPTYDQILAFLQSAYRGIYGQDIYLGNDSQDGQWLAILATAMNDCNNAAIANYNAKSPSTAQGNSLSSIVKINGLKRAVSTNSTANLTIVGVAGTTITKGIVQDAAGNNWYLPASVSIPNGGTTTATATCATNGAINAVPGAISNILTPQLGWQSASNAAAAVAGAPVQSDANLRQQQAVSAGLPAQTVLGKVSAAIADLAGVVRYTGYENPTGTTDANGLPPHSLSMVVQGGSAFAIATAIANTKTIGAPTYGTTSEVINTAFGIPETINFFVETTVRIVVDITLTPVNGYTSVIGTEIQTAITNYINALATGQDLMYTRVFSPANLVVFDANGNSVYGADGLTYEINTLTIGVFGGSQGTSDIVIAFNAAASCQVSDVNITVA